MLVDGVSTTKFAVEQQISVSMELTLFSRFDINSSKFNNMYISSHNYKLVFLDI